MPKACANSGWHAWPAAAAMLSRGCLRFPARKCAMHVRRSRERRRHRGRRAATLGSVTAGYDNALVARNSAEVTANGAVSGGGGICAETNAGVTANGSSHGPYLPA